MVYRGIRMEDTTAVSEYFMMRSEDLVFCVKNPLSGRICVPEVGEVIMDDEHANGEVKVRKE